MDLEFVVFQWKIIGLISEITNLNKRDFLIIFIFYFFLKKNNYLTMKIMRKIISKIM